MKYKLEVPRRDRQASRAGSPPVCLHHQRRQEPHRPERAAGGTEHTG